MNSTATVVAVPARNTNTEVMAMAVAIADDHSICTIEVKCKAAGGSAADGWLYRVDQLEEHVDDMDGFDTEEVKRAVAYLEQRGILVRSAADPNVVSFRDAPA